MRFNPINQFIGRDKEVQVFDRILDGNEQQWVMLVDGLSGSGKTLLIDWLRKFGCKQIPSAKITLSQSSNISDLLICIAEQLNQEEASNYREAIKKFNRNSLGNPLVHYAPTYSTQASLGGSISETSQSGDMNVEVGSYTDILKAEREANYLDIFLDSLEKVLSQPWVLFIDETGFLANPELRSFILEKLILRLHTRFPKFKLYLSGQIVPCDEFPSHEKIYITLDLFLFEHVVELLTKLGVEENAVHKAAFDMTLGHPLLLGMLAEYLLTEDEKSVSINLMDLDLGLGEGDRTQWIYQRIASRIKDVSTRNVALNLASFEWFDLSFLRDVFDNSISEEAFYDLVQRSFVKSLDNGKWRCHDIIIKYLRPQRSSIAPDETHHIQQQAFEVLVRRLTEEEARREEQFFINRIDLTTAAFHSALSFSMPEAKSFVLREIALAFAEYNAEYLYSFARYVESCAASNFILELIQQLRESINAINCREFNHKTAEFTAQLSLHAHENGDVKTAETLIRSAAKMALRLNDQDKATLYAKRAITLDDNEKNTALLAEIFTIKSDFEEAKQLILEAKAKHGDSAILRICEAELAETQQEEARFFQILTDTIATFPDSIVARIKLASILIAKEKFEPALAQLDIVLDKDSSHVEALQLKMGLLAQVGKFSEVIEITHNRNIPLASLLDNALDIIGIFSNPIQKNRILNELLFGQGDASVELAFPLAQVLALEGDVEMTRKITSIIIKKWPEARVNCKTFEAHALLISGDIDSAKNMFESLITHNTATFDAFFLLSLCHLAQGEPVKQRKTLEKAAKHFPAMQDIIDFHTSHSYLKEGSLNEALNYLKSVEKQRGLNAKAQEAMADILVCNDQKAEALKIIERLLYTADRSDIPLPTLIDIRFKYASLLIAVGKTDKAIEVANSLLEWSVDKRLTAPKAALIFWMLKSEEGLRTAYNSTDHWSPVEKSAVIGWLALIVQSRTSTLEGLFNELTEYPDRVEIILAIDLIVTSSGQVDNIHAAMTKAQEISPGAVTSFMSLSKQVLALSNPIMIQQQRDAKNSMPDNIQLRISLAQLLLAQQQFEEAKEEFEELLEIQPDLYEFTVGAQAEALIEAKQLEEAGEVLKPFLEQQPYPRFLLGAIGNYYNLMGDYKKEVQMHLGVADAYPELRQTAIENVVDIHINQKNYEEALSIIEQLENEGELKLGILLSRSNALRGLQRFNEALEVIDSLLKRENISDKTRSYLWYDRGKICMELSLVDDALKAFLESERLDPKDPNPHFELAEIFIKKEKWPDAYDSLTTGLAIEPERLVKYEDILRDVILKKEKVLHSSVNDRRK